MAALAVGAFSLTACDDESDEKDATGSTSNAFIRVIHLSPSAPTVDVFVDGRILESGLDKEETSQYFEVSEGTYTIEISAAGSPPEDAVKRVEGIALESGNYYTAFAYGDVSDLRVGLMIDDYGDRSDGTFRVRPVHAAEDFGEVDIWNLTEGQEAGILYENVPFGAVGAYLDLPVGSYTLGIDANDDGRPDAVFETPSIEEGAVINLFAVSQAPEVFLLAQSQIGAAAKIDVGVATVRLMHISVDAPAVDVWMNDSSSPFAADLNFADGTEYKTVYSGLHNFHIAPSGTSPDDAVLHAHDLFLRPGRAYTVAAYNNIANIQGMLLEDDNSPLDDGKIRVRAIHAASGVGTVDIWNVTRSDMPSVLYDGLKFASVGDYYELPADEYTLGFDVNGDGSSDVTFEIPRLPEGSIANVYAVNDGLKVSLIAQLSDGGIATIGGK
jgi:hypothetical protein